MVFSVRTIFLFIRGIDQTGRAIRKPTKDMQDLEKQQAKLATSGFRLMFAGAAFLSFGAMLAKGIAGIVDQSTRGQIIMNDFETVMTRFKNNLSEAFVDKFGETLEDWISALDDLANDELLQGILAGALKTVLDFTLSLGAFTLATGFGAMLLSGLAAALGKLGLTGLSVAVAGAGTALMALMITAILTFAISKVLWNLLPEDVQAAIEGALDMLQEEADKLQRTTFAAGKNIFSPIQYAFPEGQEPSFWEKFFMTGPAFQNMVHIRVNVNNNPDGTSDVEVDTDDENTVIDMVGVEP